MESIGLIVRKQFTEGDDIRDAGLVAPEDVERIDDIQYGELPYWQTLDVYRPKGNDEVLPVIVSIHGGGWVYGDKERYSYYCMSLAQHGFAVINYTYRLAPEYKFPASLEDTNAVFTWIFENAKKYKLDLNNVFALGDSAGGHLLSMYVAIQTDTDYANNFDLMLPNIKFNAIALNCGAYTIEPEGLTSELMKDLLPKGGIEEEITLMNTINYVNKDFPPVFLMTCTNDFLQNDATLMATKLVMNKVPFEFHYFGNSELLLGHVFHLNMKLDIAKECNRMECDFFKSYVK
ncbi:MAG: alpha/beta hydrolase [Holdemanella sp.]|nr:alpha/beta hydrolase [Holdemanella sp.]